MLVLLRRLALRGLQDAELGRDVPNITQHQNAEHGGLMKTHQLFFALSDMRDPFLDVVLTHRFYCLMNPFISCSDTGGLSRRDAVKATLATLGLSAAAFEPAAHAQAATPDPRRGAVKRYDMLKSINLWAFPYPQRMTLRECMQLTKDAGFDGIELNYDLDNDLSPKHGTQDYKAIRKMADDIGIQISGLCSFLFWPYPLTSNDPAKRAQGMDLAGKIAQCAHDLGVENVLVVPGAVHIPWRDDHEPVANDVCDQRAREAVGQLAKQAEKLKVCLNIENIFFQWLPHDTDGDELLRGQLPQRTCPRAFRYGKHLHVSVPGTLGQSARPTHQERPSQGVHQEGHGLLSGDLPSAAGWHHELAGGDGCAGGRGLQGLPDFSIFPPLHALP